MKRYLAVVAFLSILSFTSASCVYLFSAQDEFIPGVWYKCFNVKDYKATINGINQTVEEIPVTSINIIDTKIEKLEEGVFTQHEDLLVVTFIGCEIKEIEDRAFRNLKLLKMLILSKNKLEVLKAVWFENLSNLAVLVVNDNRVKQIESMMFSNKVNLTALGLGDNKLECFDFTPLINSSLSVISLRENPWSNKCQADMSNWLKLDNAPRTDLIDTQESWSEWANITWNCLNKITETKPDNNVLNSCVQPALDNLIIEGPGVTTEQIVEILDDSLLFH
ncbi:SLIT and NTRK-like protein 3 [Cephus cinctus]|uniref:SLIT and NTRK-like protein 3 n=1 Tax=Cephus cinctus TaxID=211228 RepID=A0AAJ7BPZ6_CEPCN|nr:SLIT and NTRK-like protein 3 [Cephus cinctus]